MKKYFLPLLLLLFNTNINAQNEKYNLGVSEQLLEGLSFNYQYQNQTAIHIDFMNEKLTYKWILGRNADKPAKTFTYKSRQLDNGIYLVNWHEAELKNFITLVFNFNTNTVSSSVIVRYGEENQFTTFDTGFISQIKKQE